MPSYVLSFQAYKENCTNCYFQLNVVFSGWGLDKKATVICDNPDCPVVKKAGYYQEVKE